MIIIDTPPLNESSRLPRPLNVLLRSDEVYVHVRGIVSRNPHRADTRDTPPLTAVSDAFPLIKKVDGVLIVGRVGRNR